MSPPLNCESLIQTVNLLEENFMLSPARKYHLVRTLVETRSVRGDVVEVGCNEGLTSCLIRFTLDVCNNRKNLHCYDGFVGLTGFTPRDGTAAQTHPEGTFRTEFGRVLHHFRRYGLKGPVLHDSLVELLGPDDFPEEISLAFLDLDLYGPTLHVLDLIWTRMSPGGIIVIDDYMTSTFPGVKWAVDEFFRDKDVVVETPSGVDITGVVRCKTLET